MTAILTLDQTPWYFIHRLYNLASGGLVCPGRVGTYGALGEADEPMLGFTLGVDARTEKHLVPRGEEISLVYPSRCFVCGTYEDDDTGEESPMSPEQLYPLLRELGFMAQGFWEPVLVHSGWANGTWSWRPSLRCGTDTGISLYTFDTRKAEACGWEVLEDRSIHHEYRHIQLIQ